MHRRPRPRAVAKAVCGWLHRACTAGPRALLKAGTRRESGWWAALVLLVLAEHAWQGERGLPWSPFLAGVGALVVAGALAETAPLVSWLLVGTVALSQVIHLSVGPPFLLSYVVALTVVSHRIGRTEESVERPLLGFSLSVLAGLLLAVVPGLLSGGSLPQIANNLQHWFYLLGMLLFLGVLPWFVGRYRRLHAGLMSAGWERARQLEREQEITATQERLRERARIAQDMHDSLGHTLGLIAVQAGVWELDSSVDERCREFAGEMRLAATGATEELHTVVGVLRHGAAPAVLERVQESIAELVDRSEAAGADVRLEREGEPVESAPLVDRAAYRVVQESLTNAAKHAPAAEVLVELAYRPDETAVTVTNGPALDGRSATATGGRRGLVGLEERVRLVGGELTAGPHGSGFRVTARLPHGAGLAVRDAVEAGGEAGEDAGARSLRALEGARRRLRWRLVQGIALPLGLCVALTVLVLGGCAVWVFDSVLPPVGFERLRAGESEEQVARSLPAFELHAPELTDESPRPAKASCSYYLTGPGVVPAPESLYRLCFVDGRLAAKDTVPARFG